LPDTPAAFNRSTSRTWRIAILSAGIIPSTAKAKGADAKRASGDAAYPGEIIPEWQATSSRSAERDQIAMAGDIISDSWATSPGICSEPALATGAGFAFEPVDAVDDDVEAAARTAANAGSRDGHGEMRLAGAGRGRDILRGTRGGTR
jgi:hypothetical protein